MCRGGGGVPWRRTTPALRWRPEQYPLMGHTKSPAPTPEASTTMRSRQPSSQVCAQPHPSHRNIGGTLHKWRESHFAACGQMRRDCCFRASIKHTSDCERLA